MEPGTNLVPDEFSHYMARGASLRAEFERADPFPLLVLDDFLVPELADALVAEFPSVDEMPRSRDYVFGNKHELSSVESRGPASSRLYQALLSDEFRRFLVDTTGYDVFVDPAFHGGGFHQGADGSYLDMHVDFNVHPLHADWHRMLNILLYLNPAWKAEYGGELLVKSAPDAEARAIPPVFNRAVIMLTAATTYHGYRKMSLPAGVTRRSIATYAYRMMEPGEVRARTTGWVPEDAGVLKRLLALNYDRLVRVKNKIFGSGTAGNR